MSSKSSEKQKKQLAQKRPQKSDESIKGVKGRKGAPKPVTNQQQRVNAKPKALEPKPPDKEELARLVREALQAAEMEQSSARAQLQARVQQLEGSIAQAESNIQSSLQRGDGAERRLKSQDSPARQVGKVGLVKLQARYQPEEEPPSGTPTHTRSSSTLRPSSAADHVGPASRPSLGGVVKITKGEAKSYQTRRIYEKLHEDASHRFTRFVTRRHLEAVEREADSSHSRNSEVTNPTSSSTNPASSSRLASSQLSAASYHLEALRGKARQNQEVPDGAVYASYVAPSSFTSMSMSNLARPSSAAASLQMKRSSSTSALLHGADAERKDKHLTKRVSSLSNKRSLTEGGKHGNADVLQTQSLTKTLAPARSETGTQWGASVLHTRIPAEMAGPARMPLLRSVIQQHLRETAW